MKMLLILSVIIVMVELSSGREIAGVAEANKYRRRYLATPDLHYSSNLARDASECASFILDKGLWDIANRHPCGPGEQGENIYIADESSPAESMTDLIEAANYAWYSERSILGDMLTRMDEEQYYSNFKAGDVGHFTQLVWKSSTHIGCGIDVKPVKKIYKYIVVCRYSPRGNDYAALQLQKNIPSEKELSPTDTVCKDQYPDKCASLSAQCHLENLRKFCSKTCGVCKEERKPQTNCHDDDPIQCSKSAKYCNFPQVKERCKSTCNQC